MRPSPPGMVLNLPAHTQKQLALMAASPAPKVSDDASPMDQYRLTMAQRYRQQIQHIMDADLLAQDPDAITPAPITTTSQITNAILTADFDEVEVEEEEDDELLPPYEEEDNASDCTITVQEIDSPDTPSDNNTLGTSHFFADYSAVNGERPNSASSEPTSIVQVDFEPKQLGRARALTLTKKGAVSVVEKPSACREHHFLRPRSRSNSAGNKGDATARPKISSRNSKVRKQLASLFGSKAHDHSRQTTTVRTGAVL
ncbi:putative phospholipid-transporting atpase iib [Diplodia corticola]|uniref:Putative phospholipid-transporting atpase iib n=1 Tax=Diplodia corticola TaxID=236234 RepID=A0A1J9QLN5_9PEZI|nr:putative phospholipid-transporting atpase iib [Diplodia corticola]OJD28978.1 putative phospholipid-transporting atpase iib [Diplodia corticola]